MAWPAAAAVSVLTVALIMAANTALCDIPDVAAARRNGVRGLTPGFGPRAGGVAALALGCLGARSSPYFPARSHCFSADFKVAEWSEPDSGTTPTETALGDDAGSGVTLRRSGPEGRSSGAYGTKVQWCGLIDLRYVRLPTTPPISQAAWIDVSTFDETTLE